MKLIIGNVFSIMKKYEYMIFQKIKMYILNKKIDFIIRKRFLFLIYLNNKNENLLLYFYVRNSIFFKK